MSKKQKKLKLTLTAAENELLVVLGDAFNRFAKLPVLHAHDMPETVRDIHDLQNRVLARPAMRELYK